MSSLFEILIIGLILSADSFSAAVAMGLRHFSEKDAFKFAAASGSIPGAAARPARKSEFITIYCTGLGDVSNRPASGVAASGSSLSMTTANPTVAIGGIAAPVSFSGLAPGFVGLYQVNVQVPDSAASGNNVQLILNIGGLPSNTVTIAVQ